MLRLAVMVLLALGCTPALAIDSLVGKDAPDFSATSTLEETEFRTLADCAGDVVVIRVTCC